jgi:hypothetical protein
MTAVASLQTRKQTSLFGEFLSALQNLKDGLQTLAEKYKTCVDGGVDMSSATLELHGVPRGLTLRLAKIADGRLLPDVGYHLLAAPDAVVHAVSALPKDTQAKLANDGVPVWRGTAAKVVPINEVMEREARRLVDTVSGRLLPPEEQAARSAPAPKRTDQRVELLLTREQYNDLTAEARRSGQSLSGYVLSQLVKAGVLEKRRKTKDA